MTSRHSLGIVALLAVTAVWGSTFPGMKVLTPQLDALELIGLRCLISGLVFIPLMYSVGRSEWRWGVLAGVVMFLAFYLQVIGLAQTTSNRNAFVTGLNVLIVPFLAALLGQRLRWTIWLGAVCALLGLAGMFYEDAPWSRGDTWTLLGAILYAVYIVLLEFSGKTAQRPRPAGLAAVQSLTVLLLATAVYFVTESARWPTLWTRAAPDLSLLLYLGIVASGVVVWLQTWGQHRVRAVEAALIYALEPVFAAIAAAWWIDEHFGLRAGMGAGLIVLGMMWSQLDVAALRRARASGAGKGLFGWVGR